MKDLSTYRRSYEKSELLETTIPEDPINLFHRWFHEIENFGGNEEVNAMNVATIDANGFPKNRVVLLKKFNEEGFIFYTNYDSEKGKALLKNPKVCLSFFWQTAERQVIITGNAEKTTPLLSDNYFASRPHGSQLGAWASNQSEVIKNRTVLENKLQQLEQKYKEKSVPRPTHWGGFLVRPEKVEFWQGRPNRLHDRIRYTLQQDYDWTIERLSP